MEWKIIFFIFLLGFIPHVTVSGNECFPCLCSRPDVVECYGVLYDGYLSVLNSDVKNRTVRLGIYETLFKNVDENFCTWKNLIVIDFEKNAYLNCSALHQYIPCVKIIGQCNFDHSTIVTANQSTYTTVGNILSTVSKISITTSDSSTSTYFTINQTSVDIHVKSVNVINYIIGSSVGLFFIVIIIVMVIKIKRKKKPIRRSRRIGHLNLEEIEMSFINPAYDPNMVINKYIYILIMFY